MDAQTLVNLVIDTQRDLAALPGAILYTGLDTIRPWPVYALGFNPGGDPNLESTPLSESAARTPATAFSAYRDEDWGKGGAGNHPYQARACRMLEAIGVDPRATPSSNIIFQRSRTMASLEGLSPHELARRAWMLHEQLLRIIRPRVILCFGNGAGLSTLSLVRDILAPGASMPLLGNTFRDGRYFLTSGGLQVIGAPHPSRFEPSERLVDFLRDSLAVSTSREAS